MNKGKTSPGFRLKKSLGQHFLIDQSIIKKIISSAGSVASDLILEIGPGRGALTLPLARLAGEVIAVEKDAQLIHLLKKKLSREGITNVILINQDILKWDFRELTLHCSTKIKVMGNLPYNISTPFLEKLIENRRYVSRAVLMFQLEIAERLTASPGNRTYGALTVLVQYHAHATPLFKVSKKAFYPNPKVDSMVLELDFEQHHPRSATDEILFRKVVRGSFAHRRKTLLNSLKDGYPLLNRELILKGLISCGIDPMRRAETLSIDEFLSLASALELTERSS